MVRLPPDFAPAEDDIQVWIVPRGRKESDCSSDAMLTRAVQHHAPGMFSLEVNYPTSVMGRWVSSPPSDRRGAGFMLPSVVGV
jgi:hypothetical protein